MKNNKTRRNIKLSVKGVVQSLFVQIIILPSPEAVHLKHVPPVPLMDTHQQQYFIKSLPGILAKIILTKSANYFK
jgi:hypothetical protein